MTRYFKRSLKRMMQKHILESGTINFSHQQLMKTKERFAKSIPRAYIKTTTTIQSYYNLMADVRELLRLENKKILISRRGRGYKLADEKEKIVDSFRQLDKGHHNTKISYQIITTVEIPQLTESQKEIHNLLKTYSQLTKNVYDQFLDDLRKKGQLDSNDLTNRIDMV